MHPQKQLLYFLSCLGLLSLRLSPNGAAATLIVFPRLLEERSDAGELLVAVRENITLTLRKATVLNEVFDVTTFEDDQQVLHRMNGKSMEKNLYHDPERDTALLVTRNGGLTLTGILEGTSRIQPLDSAGVNLVSEIPHEIVPIEAKVADGKRHFPVYFEGREEPAVSLPDEVSQKYQHIHIERRSGGSIYPLNVTCETRIAVDATFLETFNGSKQHVVEYFAVLTAFVNLKLRGFQSHIVILRLLVTGIVIFNWREEQKFTERLKEDTSVMLDRTLYNFNLYASDQEIFKSDDIIVLFTGLDLAIRYSKPTPVVQKNAVGLAQVSGACGFSKTALVEDQPRTFSSVHTAAHEIGHLLGALHDGSRPLQNSKSGIDPTSCPASEKHIMTPFLSNNMKPTFSYCSTIQVAYFVLSDQGRCLTTTVSRSTRIITYYDIMRRRPSPEIFCRRHYNDIKGVYYEAATDPNSPHRLENCIVTCKDPSRPYLTLISDAPDGMKCNKSIGTICMNSICTPLNRNPLQTFGKEVELHA